MLRTDAEGRVPGIMREVTRDASGKFYTATGRGQFTVWDSKGAFVRNVGRAGQGPGEFGGAIVALHVDHDGWLYVRDAKLRWSIFSPAHEFRETRNGAGMGYYTASSSFLDDARFLTAQPSDTRPEFYFHIYDFGRGARRERGTEPQRGRPVLVRSFGPVPQHIARPDLHAQGRLVTYVRGAEFWAGPPRSGVRGYELELWDTAGRLLRAIRRDVKWFPAAQPAASPAGAPPPQISMLQDDGEGLLYVIVGVPKTSWQALGRARSADEMRRADLARWDAYVEVIDTRAGAVLVSAGPMSGDAVVKDFPHGVFNGSRSGYAFSEDQDGHTVVRMLNWQLIAR